jgi:hypothetical protein
MKLNEGDKIEVAGGSLPDTEPGVYWIAYVSYCKGHPYYGLRKFYGREIISKFFTNVIDAMVGQQIQVVA